MPGILGGIATDVFSAATGAGPTTDRFPRRLQSLPVGVGWVGGALALLRLHAAVPGEARSGPGRTLAAAILLLHAAGAGARADAELRAAEARRPQEVRRLLHTPECEKAFRLLQDTRRALVWGAWKSHGLLLLAAGVLVVSGAYAPWLVGAMGSRGWFRWCIEWIPYTLFATVGLDFDGVGARWG